MLTPASDNPSIRLRVLHFPSITSPVKVLLGTLLVCFALVQAEGAAKKVTPRPKKTAAKAKASPSPTPKNPAAPPAQQVYPVALPNYDEQTAVQLQIFLDN